MKFISLILLLIGIMLITVSYTKEKTNNMNNIVEYRYIPQWLYDEQFGHIDLQKKYDDVFMKSNPGPFGLDTKYKNVSKKEKVDLKNETTFGDV